MKAYLKALDGSLFQLSPKFTTIGRENCDLTIQVPGIDYQHAVIEYSEQEDCLIIQDLNTAQGTYVNDVRIQNAAVRLAPGDCIRFGYNGSPYELQLEQTQMVSCPPLHQRPAWSGPLTILNEAPNYTTAGSQQRYQQPQQQIYQQSPHLTSAGQNFPFVTSTPPTQSFAPGGVWTHPIPQNPVPRPPLRSRPLSAGSNRRSTFDIPRFQPVSTIGAPVSRQAPSGWVNGSQQGVLSPELDLASQALERDQRINQLLEEVTRLRTVEFQSFRKDQLIEQLQQQISNVESKLHQEPSIIMGTGDAESSQRLAHLETEVNTKKGEIAALKEQLSRVQMDGTGNPLMLRQELGERMTEVNSLRSELERVKKDKNITSGLVTQMQRDMSNKPDEVGIASDYNDSTISKLTREIEVLKKEMRERDKLLSSANVKVNKLPASSKVAEEKDAREKELISLRQRFKEAENKNSTQFNTIAALREEIETLKKGLFEEKETRRKLQAEADTNKSQFLDMQRTERVVRIDLEQAQKTFERFRSRLIQTTFSSPGVKAPETEISDDELLLCLKKLLDERTELVNKIRDLQNEVKQAFSSTDALKEKGEKLRAALQESVDRLKQSGRLSAPLKQEMSVVQSLTTDEALVWIRDMIADIFTSELHWQESIDAALEKCGVSAKLSSEAPDKHIELLFAKWESALSEKERLTAQMAEMEGHHQEEMKVKLEAQLREMENKITDAVERARLEGEEKLNRAIDDIRAVESEKLQIAIAEEKRRAEELEATIGQLRQSLMQRQDEDISKLEQASELVTQVEQYKLLETELKDHLVKLEERMKTEILQLQEEKNDLTRRSAESVEVYKEQVRQHSVTICSMEERLSKLNKRSKDYQEEISVLKKNNSELQAELDRRIVQKPVIPPKPKVILQRPTEEISALEHITTMLRQENADLKKSVTEQQDVIMGLRRDLSGASARLSDITGEISESQKREMEQNRELLKRRDAELTELRQQMAKLSKIIDKQTEEVKKLQEELSKEKTIGIRCRSDLEERDSRLQEMELRLKDERDEQKKQLALLDQEGRITSELVGLGAQCRGERHEKIIMRQREALAELRARVKSLEMAKPPLPTQDQALQQVVMLKKELAEMRANQALAEDRIIASATSLDREVGKVRGMITPANPEAEMERSAHRETLDALESSESTYLTLLRAIANTLELEEIQGLRALAHMPKDERERLVLERESACEFLAGRIQVLKERIARKDELLQGYERDLSKLRQSQEIADKKATQVEALSKDVRTRAEESQYLRESLNRTRDQLNQEKRLNNAIKQKKTFHLENERAHLQQPPSYRSKSQEHQATGTQNKKLQKELLKRKNYEIRTLKEELCDKEQALYDREKRLMSIERGMGLERPLEVLD